MNVLYDVNNIIDFGILKGERIFRIYRHHITYLEWLIKKTDICFTDLSEFYKYGKVNRFNPKLSASKRELIIKEITGDPNSRTLNGSKLLTIKNLDNLIRNGILTEADFVAVDYHFSKELFIINSTKNKDCESHKVKLTVENIYTHKFFCEGYGDIWI